MAITSMDALVTAMPGQILSFYKPSQASEGAGFLHSLWRAAGTPGAGAIPATGSGQTCSSLTAGALKFNNPTGGQLTYLARALMGGSVTGSLIIYDRLVATSGLSGIVTGVQNVNSEALTRYTTGDDVTAFIEWYTATGSTSANITVNYTNHLGSTGQITEAQAFGSGAPTAGQMQPITLNAGDGIRRVESVTLSGTTGTAGNFGITLARRLITIPLGSANVSTTMDAFATMAKIENSACLAAMVFCSATTTGNIIGELSLIQG